MKTAFAILLLFFLVPIYSFADQYCIVKSETMDIYSAPDLNHLQKDRIYVRSNKLTVLEINGDWVKIKDSSNEICYLYNNKKQLKIYQTDDSLLCQISQITIFGGKFKVVAVYFIVIICVLWWIVKRFNEDDDEEVEEISSKIGLFLILPVTTLYIILCNKSYINNYMFGDFYITTDGKAGIFFASLFLQIWNLLIFLFAIFTICLMFVHSISNVIENAAQSARRYRTKRHLIGRRLILANVLLSAILPIALFFITVFAKKELEINTIGEFITFIHDGLFYAENTAILIFCIVSLLFVASIIYTTYSAIDFLNRKVSYVLQFLFFYYGIMFLLSFSFYSSLIQLNNSRFFEGLLVLFGLVLVLFLFKSDKTDSKNYASSGGYMNNRCCGNCRYYGVSARGNCTSISRSVSSSGICDDFYSK